MDPVAIQLAQLVAYSMLTLSSILVASVSLMFGYRQNFGWKPIALVTSHGFSGGKVDGYYGATLDIEIWNRRRYPVVVRHIEVKSQVIEFERSLQGWTYPDNWLVNRKNQIISRTEISLDPSGKASLSFELPFKKRTLDDLVDLFTIRINYFDPRLAKLKTINIEHKFHFAMLNQRQ